MRVLGKYTAGLFLSACLSGEVLASNIISSSGFTNCLNNATIKVNNANINFDRTTLNVTFDVSGTSTMVQNVSASLVVTAYGQQVYQKSFDPCASATFVEELCPGKSGRFLAMITYSNSHDSSSRYVLCTGLTANSSKLCKPNTLNRVHNTRFRWASHTEVDVKGIRA
jgi:hypothetical protein